MEIGIYSLQQKCSQLNLVSGNQHNRKGSPLAMALNETLVYPKGNFRPVRRHNSDSVRDIAKVTISPLVYSH